MYYIESISFYIFFPPWLPKHYHFTPKIDYLWTQNTRKKAENESISLDLMRKPQNDNELLTMARHEKASSFTFYDSDSRAQNMRE